MKNVRALVIGVSRYYNDNWNTDGPARNASAITDWLLDLHVPAERIHLFSDIKQVDPDVAERLASAGVAARQPIHADISRFWRAELPSLAENGDQLFFFWSGHGVTQGSSRLFFCGDYSSRMTTSVLNMTEVASTFRTNEYRKYANQLLFADVCGTYSRALTNATSFQNQEVVQAVEQFTAFATREGEYTKMTATSGVFTDALLDTFTRVGRRWPEEKLFRPALEEVSRHLEQQPYTIDVKGRNGQSQGMVIGTGELRRPALAASTYEMLAKHDMRAFERRHFKRTMEGLGVAPAAGVPSLRSYVYDLADLQDARDGQAPYGLVEFLARLASDPLLGDAGKRDIDDWLQTFGQDRLREAQDRIEADRSTRKLLFEVREAGDRPNEVLAYMRFSDMTVVPGFDPSITPVTDWDGLCSAVRKTVEDPSLEAERGDLELHFLADPVLFDLPFHEIKDSNAEPLGERFVCIVHSRQRANLHEGAPELANWRDWSAKLGADGSGAAPWAQVVPNAGHSGYCYAHFTVEPSPQGSMGKKQIARAIRLGAPVLCWPHAGSPENKLPDDLQALTAEAFLGNRGLPATFFRLRIAGHNVASHFSILCDDPDFRPFVKMQGAG